jgi:hypothetical protein
MKVQKYAKIPAGTKVPSTAARPLKYFPRKTSRMANTNPDKTAVSIGEN